MAHYNEDFKQAMIKKLCLPEGPSVYQLSKENGISPLTLRNWVKKYGGGIQVNRNKRPEDWTPEEKLQAVFKASGLEGEKLGEFLRSQGLHSHHIEEWKTDALQSAKASTPKRGRPRKDPELADAQSKIKLLEKDIRRKDKALAEQTAIVILQKKAQELWGTDEDDE